MIKMQVGVQNMGQGELMGLQKSENLGRIAARIDDHGLLGIIIHKVTIGFQRTKLKSFDVQHGTSQGLYYEPET
jgi:hypothetical protein